MKKLSVQVHSYDRELEYIMRIVESVNEGKIDISFRDLQGYFACSNAQFPYAHKFTWIAEEDKFHISQKGKLICTITEKFISELSEFVSEDHQVQIESILS